LNKNKKKDQRPLLLKVVAWAFPKLEIIAPWLAKRWFTRIFFRPIRYKRPQAEIEIEQEARLTNLEFNNKKVQVYVWGEGTPILFVHGWMSRGTQFRKFVEPFNQAGYKIIAFDAPAHGNSQGNKSDIFEIRDIVNILSESYDFEAVVGHSIGGVAAMHALLKDKFSEKLIMIGSPSMADKIIGAFQKRLNASDEIKKYFYQHIIEKYNRTFEEFSASHIVKELRDVELLLIHDKQDFEVTLDNAQLLHELYPQSGLMVTEGLGHTRILKDKTVIASCIEFIREKSFTFQ